MCKMLFQIIIFWFSYLLHDIVGRVDLRPTYLCKN